MEKINPPDFPQGLEWFNTAEPLNWEKLRGKIVLLDFWTYCCINCMHVLPDLKRLEQKYADSLVVIGVHCAKFSNEAVGGNIRQAIARYNIEHAVVNDHTYILWRQFNVRAWPTMALIDPEGMRVGTIAGEGNWDFLNESIGALIKEHEAKGTLKKGAFPLLHREPEIATSLLSFPGKIIADEFQSKLWIADSNHHRILQTDLLGNVQTIIGSGKTGLQDGPFAQATFNQPQGLCLIDDKLYIADTENHAIRCADCNTRRVDTVAGTGKQAAPFATMGDPLRTHLNSPWDLTARGNHLYIAMAGSHQIWIFDLDENRIGPFAGIGQENRIDGDLGNSCFAQPSGITLDKHNLYVADSETSSIRKIDLSNGSVSTIVGLGLFDFGDLDGAGSDVRLQHPIGIHAFGGKLFVADTYNHKIKLADPLLRRVMTLVGTGKPGRSTGSEPALYEPCGLAIATPHLYIADTNNHRIVRMHLEDQVVMELKISS